MSTPLSNEENSKNRDLTLLLLLFGIGFIGFNLYYKYERYYLGEQLIEKVIRLEETPVYVKTGKGGTDRYSISGTGYLCRFWLSKGALSIIRDNEGIENSIRSLKKGDTVSIKIRQTDEQVLQTFSATPRVIELAQKQELIIQAAEVEARDRKWYYINLGVGIGALLIWIVIQLWRGAKKLNNYFQEPVEEVR